jgi:hypothetical protein
MEFLINVDSRRLSDLSGSLPVILDQFIYGTKIPFNIYLCKDSGSNATEPILENQLLTTVIGDISTMSSSILFMDTHSFDGTKFTGTLSVSGSAMKIQLWRETGSIDVSFQIKTLNLVNGLTDVYYSGTATILTNVI